MVRVRRTNPAMRAALALAGALGLGAGLAGAAPVASTGEPTQQELLEQIRALKAKVERIQADQAAQSPPRQDPARIDEQSTIDSVLRDAERRSTIKPLFFQTGPADVVAGHSKGKFFIRSADGEFSFTPTFQFQMRYVVNNRQGEGGNDDESSTESGFEFRRMKFGAEGKVFKDFEYKVVWFTNRAGGGVALEDAIIKYQLKEDLNLVLGQFKDPVHHEELISSSKQLSADRSLVNELIGGGFTDRVQGVGIEYKRGPWEIFTLLHDGVESLNTNFRDPPTNDTEYGVAARVEYLLLGNKKYYGDFTAMGNTEDMMAVGAGVDFSGMADSNALTYTVDWQYEFANKVGLYAAFLGNNLVGHGDLGEVNHYGGLVQAAYMLTDKWEAFGRYGLICLDDDTVDVDETDEVHEVVGGVNYYMHGHNAKFTADATFLPNGSPGDSGLGIIDSGDDSQVVVRFQFQLLI